MTYRHVKEPMELVVNFKAHLRAGASVDAYERTSRREHAVWVWYHCVP